MFIDLDEAARCCNFNDDVTQNELAQFGVMSRPSPISLVGLIIICGL